MWCECDSRTLDEELCSPAPHRTESQTTCGHCLHPAFPGETRAHMEWVGASLAVSCGMERAAHLAENCVEDGLRLVPSRLHPLCR